MPLPSPICAVELRTTGSHTSQLGGGCDRRQVPGVGAAAYGLFPKAEARCRCEKAKGESNRGHDPAPEAMVLPLHPRSLLRPTPLPIGRQATAPGLGRCPPDISNQPRQPGKVEHHKHVLRIFNFGFRSKTGSFHCGIIGRFPVVAAAPPRYVETCLSRLDSIAPADRFQGERGSNRGRILARQPTHTTHLSA